MFPSSTIITREPISPVQRFARHVIDAEGMTDLRLARTIVSSGDEMERKALLRELMWRWRDYPEAERPWKTDPDREVWWLE